MAPQKPTMRTLFGLAPRPIVPLILISALVLWVLMLLIWFAAIGFAVTRTDQRAQGDMTTYREAADNMFAGITPYDMGQWDSWVNFRYHPAFLLVIRFAVSSMLVLTLLNLVSYVSANILQYRLFQKDTRLRAFAFLIPFAAIYNSSGLANISFGNINAILLLLSVFGLFLIAASLQNERHRGTLGLTIGLLTIPALMTKPQWSLALGTLLFAGAIHALVTRDRRLLIEGLKAAAVAIIGYGLITIAFTSLFPNGAQYYSDYIQFLRGADANYAFDTTYPSDQNSLKHVLILLTHQPQPWIDAIVVIFKGFLILIPFMLAYSLIQRRTTLTAYHLLQLLTVLYLVGMNLLPEYQEVTGLMLAFPLLMASSLPKGHKIVVTIIMLLWGGTSLVNFPGVMLYGLGEGTSPGEIVFFFNRWIPLELIAGLVYLGYLTALPLFETNTDAVKQESPAAFTPSITRAGR